MSRLEVVLREDQISAIGERVDDFRAAGYKGREKIVREYFEDFKKTWPQDFEEFGELTMGTVCAPFTTLGCSHITFFSLFGRTSIAEYGRQQVTRFQPPEFQGLTRKKGAHTVYSLSAAINSTMRL